MFLMVVSLI